MRKLITAVGLALVASLALVGVAATSASASEPQILLNGANTFPQLILGSNTSVSKLVAKSGTTVECGSLLIHGLIRSKLDILLLLLWHKCTEKTFNSTCHSAGEPAGLIHAVVLLLPRLLLTHLPGFLVQLEPQAKHIGEFECDAGLIKTVVNGTVEEHLDSPAINTPSNEMTVSVEVKTAGSEQLFTHDEGSNEIDHLESSQNGGAFEGATEEVPATKVHLNSEVQAEFRC